MVDGEFLIFRQNPCPVGTTSSYAFAKIFFCVSFRCSKYLHKKHRFCFKPNTFNVNRFSLHRSSLLLMQARSMIETLLILRNRLQHLWLCKSFSHLGTDERLVRWMNVENSVSCQLFCVEGQPSRGANFRAWSFSKFTNDFWSGLNFLFIDVRSNAGKRRKNFNRKEDNWKGSKKLSHVYK